jgi:hypothetical protein
MLVYALGGWPNCQQPLWAYEGATCADVQVDYGCGAYCPSGFHGNGFQRVVTNSSLAHSGSNVMEQYHCSLGGCNIAIGITYLYNLVPADANVECVSRWFYLPSGWMVGTPTNHVSGAPYSQFQLQTDDHRVFFQSPTTIGSSDWLLRLTNEAGTQVVEVPLTMVYDAWHHVEITRSLNDPGGTYGTNSVTAFLLDGSDILAGHLPFSTVGSLTVSP